MSLCSRGSTRWPPIGRQRPRFLREKEIASTFGRESERDVTPSPPTADSAAVQAQWWRAVSFEQEVTGIRSSTLAPFIEDRVKPSVADAVIASATATVISSRAAMNPGRVFKVQTARLIN